MTLQILKSFQFYCCVKKMDHLLRMSWKSSPSRDAMLNLFYIHWLNGSRWSVYNVKDGWDGFWWCINICRKAFRSSSITEEAYTTWNNHTPHGRSTHHMLSLWTAIAISFSWLLFKQHVALMGSITCTLYTHHFMEILLSLSNGMWKCRIEDHQTFRHLVVRMC